MVACAIVIVGNVNLCHGCLIQHHAARAVFGGVMDVVQYNAFAVAVFPAHIPARLIGKGGVNVILIGAKFGGLYAGG